MNVNVHFGRTNILLLVMLATQAGAGADFVPEQLTNRMFVMQSIRVNDKYKPLKDNGWINLGEVPEDIYFYFDVATGMPSYRIQTKLENCDNDWRDGGGEMSFGIRFFDKSGNLIDQKLLVMRGSSPGWNHSLNASPLTHRRETAVAPPNASKLMIVISSAGPPATLGVYAVANLTVSKIVSNSPPVLLMKSPFDQTSDAKTPDSVPSGWVRDGNRPSMAKILEIGREPATRAFVILDDSLISHAEWRNDLNAAPTVAPGDHLLIEWNEMFSSGVGDTRAAIYGTLPPGNFQFRARTVDLLGVPTGDELAVNVRVPLPFWKTYAFWGCVFVIAAALMAVGGRYLILRKVRLKVLHLEKQHLLERERMRIARNIHDDLGARVTQIALECMTARSNPVISKESVETFDRISEISRDLLTALYETVWAVNPENDNLNELGTYIFQIVDKLCERGPCRCRFRIQELPREIIVSSQVRHNICMAVKEAVHNVKKHARATEVIVHIGFSGPFLTISIQDNGCGFQIAEITPGHGLRNLQHRLKEIGGVCRIESRPGQGTTVEMQIRVNLASN